MAFAKISEQELGAVGVELLDDQPEMQPDAMKAKFEETAKQLLAPKHNTLVEQLEAETAAASLGAAVPTGLSGQTTKTVQAVLAALMAYIQAHEQKDDNPHDVTAAQTGAYTKAETDSAINAKITQIGAGDMAKATYDPQNKEMDFYAYADAAAAGKMEKSTYDPQNEAKDIFKTINAAAAKYTATLTLDGWVDAAEEEISAGYPYAQEATLTALTPGAPTVTEASEFLSPCSREPVGVPATDEALDEAMNLINSKGVTSSVNGGKIRTIIQEKPTVDVTLQWLIRTEV